MAVELSWVHPSHVLLIRYADHVTMDELREMMAQAAEVLISNEKDTPIHTIADLSKIKSIPSNLAQLGAMMDIFKQLHGLVVMVVPEKNVLMRFMASYASKMSSKNARMFTAFSFEEAISILNERVPELPIVL